jgi:hypothetical protein
MPSWAKAALDQWTAAVGITQGRVARGISQKGKVGDAMTTQAIYRIVRDYARAISGPES